MLGSGYIMHVVGLLCTKCDVAWVKRETTICWICGEEATTLVDMTSASPKVVGLYEQDIIYDQQIGIEWELTE